MIKPPKLYPGDKVATISLSWGGAGDIPHRYQAGKKQLEEVFGLEVVETKHALKPNNWLYQNPEARAEDLMEAFADESIKGIFTNIGGEDSIRTLPYIDLQIIHDNPKIFLGLSDSTVTHLCCYKAGLTSYYGTSILIGFAENGGMHPYQIEDIKRTLFCNEPTGLIQPSPTWTNEMLCWEKPENQKIIRKLHPSSGWRLLQGKGIIEGPLIGGCIEVLEFLKGTDFFFSKEDFEGAILFLETSEVKMPPENLRWILRNYAALGVFKKIKGILFGRPHDNQFWKEYDDTLLKVIREEEGIHNLPILTGMDFGHSAPTFTLPYGVKGRLDCDNLKFYLPEAPTS